MPKFEQENLKKEFIDKKLGMLSRNCILPKPLPSKLSSRGIPVCSAAKRVAWSIAFVQNVPVSLPLWTDVRFADAFLRLNLPLPNRGFVPPVPMNRKITLTLFIPLCLMSVIPGSIFWL